MPGRKYAALAGLVLGVAIHWRLYPVIYLVPAVVALTPGWSLSGFLTSTHGATADDNGQRSSTKGDQGRSLSRRRRRDTNTGDETDSLASRVGVADAFLLRLLSRFVIRPVQHVVRLVHVHTLLLVAGAMTSFMVLFGLCYAWQGDAFLFETYLYHFTRRDFQHNFSPAFLSVLLGMSTRTQRVMTLAQLFAVAALGSTTQTPTPPTSTSTSTSTTKADSRAHGRGRDVLWAVLLQTMGFVALNRVATAQYFVWWLGLVPAVIPELRWSWVLGATTVAWLGTQITWLWAAWRLEYRGENTFRLVWIAGVAFQLASSWLVFQCRRARGGDHGAREGRRSVEMGKKTKKLGERSRKGLDKGRPRTSTSPSPSPSPSPARARQRTSRASTPTPRRSTSTSKSTSNKSSSKSPLRASSPAGAAASLKPRRKR